MRLESLQGRLNITFGRHSYASRQSDAATEPSAQQLRNSDSQTDHTVDSDIH